MANIIAHQRTSRSFYLDVEIFILVYKIELHLVAQSLEPGSTRRLARHVAGYCDLAENNLR